jgi:NADPH-dependent curcumin reductase CurA
VLTSYLEADVSYLPEYIEPYRVNQPLYGVAVGTVISSNSSKWKKDQIVFGTFDWAEYVVQHEDKLEAVPEDSTPPMDAQPVWSTRSYCLFRTIGGRST